MYIRKEMCASLCFWLPPLPCQPSPDKWLRWENVSTLCFPSALFPEKLWPEDLQSNNFSFATFSFFCKYSISDFCETINVSKLENDGCWDNCYLKYMCKSPDTITFYIIYKYEYISITPNKSHTFLGKLILTADYEL